MTPTKLQKLALVMFLIYIVLTVVMIARLNSRNTDINKDGVVDALDLSLVLDDWTAKND